MQHRGRPRLGANVNFDPRLDNDIVTAIVVASKHRQLYCSYSPDVAPTQL